MASQETDRERLLNQERVILKATEAIWEQMRRTGLRKTDLAEKLGVSRARITQALDGETNLTFRTFADFASVLGCEVVIDLAPDEFNEGRDFAIQSTTTLRRPGLTFDVKEDDTRVVSQNTTFAA
jgi:transcriptional regulator with XRE-family HTH domain